MISRNEERIDETNPVQSFLPTERAGVRVGLSSTQHGSALNIYIQDRYGQLTGQRYKGSGQRDFAGDLSDHVEVDKAVSQTVVYQLHNLAPDRPEHSTVVLEVGWDGEADAIMVIGYSVVLPLEDNRRH